MTLVERLETERKKLNEEMHKLEQVRIRLDVRLGELEDIFNQLGDQLEKGCQ